MSPSILERFERHSVPLVVSLVVVAAVLLVPPLALGELTAKTYALTAAIIIIASSAVFPYAILVAVGTLPLPYAGIASFATPQVIADDSPSLSAVAALRHTVAGIAYVLGAAVVGVIGIGVQMAVRSTSAPLPGAVQPVLLYSGGLLVAGAFVVLQLWRYDGPAGALSRRTILGTVALGALLALAPVVAFWMFDSV